MSFHICHICTLLSKLLLKAFRPSSLRCKSKAMQTRAWLCFNLCAGNFEDNLALFWFTFSQPLHCFCICDNYLRTLVTSTPSKERAWKAERPLGGGRTRIPLQQRPRLGAPQQATTRETRKCLNAGLARAAACEPLTSASADLRSTPAALELPCNLLLSMDRAPSPADSPLLQPAASGAWGEWLQPSLRRPALGRHHPHDLYQEGHSVRRQCHIKVESVFCTTRVLSVTCRGISLTKIGSNEKMHSTFVLCFTCIARCSCLHLLFMLIVLNFGKMASPCEKGYR